MKYVSEDNRRHSPISLLVDRVYGRENTRYSCGKDRLNIIIKELLSLVNTEEEIIVYVDTVPGNESTLSTFTKLLKDYHKNKNVYIVPILCTEACIIKSLENMGYTINPIQKGILEGTIPYKSTKYGFEKTIKRATKLFYKDIDLLEGDLSYYESNTVEIGGVLTTPLYRGVSFIVAHKCFLTNEAISDSFSSSAVSLYDYIKMYENLFNTIADANGFNRFPKIVGLEVYTRGK